MASFLRADAPIRIPKRGGIEILPLSSPSFFLLSRRDRDYPNELTEKEDGGRNEVCSLEKYQRGGRGEGGGKEARNGKGN